MFVTHFVGVCKIKGMNGDLIAIVEMRIFFCCCVYVSRAQLNVCVGRRMLYDLIGMVPISFTFLFLLMLYDLIGMVPISFTFLFLLMLYDLIGMLYDLIGMVDMRMLFCVCGVRTGAVCEASGIVCDEMVELRMIRWSSYG
jgi:hypothetical protein